MSNLTLEEVQDKIADIESVQVVLNRGIHRLLNTLNNNTKKLEMIKQQLKEKN